MLFSRQGSFCSEHNDWDLVLDSSSDLHGVQGIGKNRGSALHHFLQGEVYPFDAQASLDFALFMDARFGWSQVTGKP